MSASKNLVCVLVHTYICGTHSAASCLETEGALQWGLKYFP